MSRAIVQREMAAMTGGLRPDQGKSTAAPLHSIYAALDLGTNNCRLLMARPSRDGFRVVDAFSRIVRLGEGLGSTQQLAEAAIERTIEALKICRNKMDNRIENLRIVNRTINSHNRISKNKYKGVYKTKNGFDAKLMKNEINYYLGYFKCENAAAIAVNKKLIELYGEFAKLNIIK